MSSTGNIIKRSAKVINLGQVVEVEARDVVPGMITLDGVVLAVHRHKGYVDIEHRSTVYAQDAGDVVQVFARLDEDHLAGVLAAIAADRKARRRS